MHRLRVTRHQQINQRIPGLEELARTPGFAKFLKQKELREAACVDDSAPHEGASTHHIIGKRKLAHDLDLEGQSGLTRDEESIQDPDQDALGTTTKPWWKSWWFYLSAGAVVIAVVLILICCCYSYKGSHATGRSGDTEEFVSYLDKGTLSGFMDAIQCGRPVNVFTKKKELYAAKKTTTENGITIEVIGKKPSQVLEIDRVLY